jgi:N-acetyl sugar amidotransferase
MDTSDPDIVFDEEGVCHHCHRYTSLITAPKYLAKKEDGALEKLVDEIKSRGKDKRYDCIIGVSGGVDSTYVAYLVKELGLRPLAVHLDNGWNSELAVANIEKVLNNLDIDLYTWVMNWEEFRDLQLAFLKSSTPDSEIPTDHAIFSLMYEIAAKEGIDYVLAGQNTATEGGWVPAWSQGHGDWKYIKSVNRLFGSGKKLKTYPHYGLFKFVYYTMIKKIQWVRILDYIDYNKDEAMDVLQNKLGWKYYGGKHYESVYTRFFQGFILPHKFGFDKKRLHLSSLIFSGQITRDEALAEMEKPDYPDELRQQDQEFLIKKFEISEEEFQGIMQAEPKSFWDYPSYKNSWLFKSKKLLNFYRSIKRS